MIKEDLSIDTKKYQQVLEHALSKVDFSVGVGKYMIGSNRDISDKKLPVAPHDPLEVTRSDLRMLAKRHNDEKLAITLAILGGGLIAYLLV